VYKIALKLRENNKKYKSVESRINLFTIIVIEIKLFNVLKKRRQALAIKKYQILFIFGVHSHKFITVS